MSRITLPVLSMEERLLPDMSEQTVELPSDDTPSYPDNWPLPPTPLAISPENLNEDDEVEKPRSGVYTPPLRQMAAQPTPPMSVTTTNRPLRSSSNSSAKSPHRKRLSLSFPIAPPVRSIPSAYASPHTPTSPIAHAEPDPNDSMAFLTSLAAQERRVLELREELQKAEAELTVLKRKWTIHEATKKRHELIQTEIIRGASVGDMGDGLKSPTIDEHEARRRAALAKLTQASTRSVTGQRHHRTLSLLSPQRTSYPQPFPQPRDLHDDAEPAFRPAPVRRSDTLPTTSTRPISMIETSAPVSAALGIKRNSQDMLLRTGKQMAEGFKEGLWAFVEDLRQATVGDDMPARPSGAPMSRSSSSLGAPSHGVRRQGSKGSLQSVSSGGGRREREKSPAVPEPESDAWRRASNHDDMPTSSARWSTTSSALSETSSTVSVTHSRSSTPRTSTRYRDLHHILHLTPILAYIFSLLPRPANINIYAFCAHQLGPIFHFRQRSHRARGNAGLGGAHVGGDAV